MKDTLYESNENWRYAEEAWQTAQSHWNDSRADLFADHFWRDFEGNVLTYLNALDELLDALEEARSEAYRE